MLTRWLKARRDRKVQVLREARDLLTFMGDGAYGEARSRAREHRARHDSGGDRHWGRVAVEIAQLTGHVIGEKAADRYSETAQADRQQPNRHAVIAELVEVSNPAAISAKVIPPCAASNVEAACRVLQARLTQPISDLFKEARRGKLERGSRHRDHVLPNVWIFGHVAPRLNR